MITINKRLPRYHFADFVVSPSRRAVFRRGRERPLIPRYLDLLLLLLERREEAIARREIFDRVWSDVVVSDGALTQAVRTLRRALGDDSKGPAFIRTVSRHGYQFVFPDVSEEDDSLPLPNEQEVAREVGSDERSSLSEPDPFEAALECLLTRDGDQGERRQAAETLHALGTEEALRRLDRRPGHAVARALLRDARWDIPAAGEVPLLGQPGFLTASCNLMRLRLTRVLRLAGHRWAGAIAGAALAGFGAGLVGGSLLLVGPGSRAASTVPVALALVGMIIAALGATGVGAGLAAAEALARSFRGVALVVLGALGGGAIGSAAHLLGRWTLLGLFGRDLSPVGGGFEGLVLGGAVGLGYALSTPTAQGGMAAPRGAARLLAAAASGACCALAAVALSQTGSYLGAMSLDLMAQSFPGSQVGLGPLARLLGEAEPGRLTAAAISAWEGALFGSGLVWGLTRRPR